jgi:uncharacterized membrane protein YedE/YeeE
MTYLRFALIGFAFGTVLMKSEAISWFRIQEMFRFQSIHMFGILGCAVVTAAVTFRLLQALGVRSVDGHPLVLEPKTMGTGARYALGGACFGVGWALTGACPGPLFTLLGSGVGVMAVAILSALAGTWTYAMLRERLPH